MSPIAYDRCCGDCVYGFKESGQLESRKKQYGLGWTPKDGERCESCDKHLVIGEIYRVEVEL